jgi:hypothetical protein
MDAPVQKEFFSVKHDALDPLGTGMRGKASGVDFTKSAHGHPVIYYKSKDGTKEMFLTADVYAIPGEPMTVHIYCPYCGHNLSIRQDNKAIDYDPKATV